MTYHASVSQGRVIRYGLAPCWLGHALIAQSDRGICWLALGDDPLLLEEAFRTAFAKASPTLRVANGAGECSRMFDRVVEILENPLESVDVPLDLRGTPFQRMVWDALRRIPPGGTLSYADLAQQVGQPRAVRAVARACGANPVAVLVPCHRVVGSDGSMTGYRWGIEAKRRLLQRESEALVGRASVRWVA